MAYIITFFNDDSPTRQYKFPKNSYRFGQQLSVPEKVALMMEWVDAQPIARTMRAQQLPYAWTPDHQSSITVRDLTEDEIVLLMMAGTPHIRIVHESKLKIPTEKRISISTAGTKYKRNIAKKRDPNTYDIVKPKPKK